MADAHKAQPGHPVDFINPSNLAFVESMRERYQADPNSVDAVWREYFEAEGPVQLNPTRRSPSLFAAGSAAAANDAPPADVELQEKVVRLVRSYRVRGHLHAKLDPLGLPRKRQPELDPAYYGIAPSDMDKPFSSINLHTDRVMTVGALIESLKASYSDHIGVQYMHIDDIHMKRWLERKMEVDVERVHLSKDDQLAILTRLTDAEALEQFIQKKFKGAKSFSLEGAESLIPLLSMAVEKAIDDGAQQVVIAMAHRGRLNVLANILGKNPGDIFAEFDDKNPDRFMGAGDVKYHMGYSSEWSTRRGNKGHLSLCFNPSHLEFVNPVALGRCRAKQDRIDDSERRKVTTILVHGDAAFIGEGVVQETLNLSQLEGYKTGGTLHIICNNQIGFTTGPEQSRSTQYATDVAKMLQVPIFHVNGEVPESVAQCVKVAADFRNKFQRDVVIDMYGYRKWGHNEGDEPAFTQPVLYDAIRKRKTVRESYLEHLTKGGQVTLEDGANIVQQRRLHLESELKRAREESYQLPENPSLQGIWHGYVGGSAASAPNAETHLEAKQAASLLRALSVIPDAFQAHKRLAKLFAQRLDMADGNRPLDWGSAELLAYASLLTQGVRIRISGQDAERGTFSHRHSILHDQVSDERYEVLNHLAASQARAEIVNSPLSEAGVLGFDYGYSLDMPDALVIWEAQFGDFANTAQVIIDQFISSAEEKWQRLSGLVMLLPHGYEGMGPEHSSARLERFLMLCAEDNMQVVVPSSPAQIFHLLRRQVLRKWRKPLIVMSPKSLLRHRMAVSELAEFTQGTFEPVLVDDAKKPERVLLCSGRIYYDLIEARATRERDDVKIIRIEELYPFPHAQLESAMKGVLKKTPVYWVQDEPENMGAWRYIRALFGDKLFGQWSLQCISRAASASPATGSKASHIREQQKIIEAAFTDG